MRVQAIRDIVRTWIYPRVKDFDVQFYSESEDSEEGFAMLHIPAQRDDDKPFVVRRMADGDEKGSVGIAERDGSDTVWWTAEGIHHRLQQGQGTRPEPPREHTPPPAQQFGERLDEHLRSNEAAQGWESEPILHLQAIPPREDNTSPTSTTGMACGGR